MLILKRLSRNHPTSACSFTRAWREQRTFSPHIWCFQCTRGTTCPVTMVATGQSLSEPLSCFCDAPALLTVPRQGWRDCHVTPAAMNSALGWACLLKPLVFVPDMLGSSAVRPYWEVNTRIGGVVLKLNVQWINYLFEFHFQWLKSVAFDARVILTWCDKCLGKNTI